MRSLAFSQKAFTLIELMIGIGILALLLFLAMPAFGVMLQNMKIRGATESILGGLQTARAEALKRNQTVQFVLTSDDPDPENVGGYTLNAAGPNWVVQAVAGAGFVFIEAKSGMEGSNQAVSNVELAAAGGAVVAFNGLGTTNLAAPLTIEVRNPLGGVCTEDDPEDGQMRCLRVEVTPMGNIRMCDPAVMDAADTRICQF